MKNVLVCNPNSYDVDIYMPYIYGLLRRMCDIVPKLEKELNWYHPVYMNNVVNDLLKDYDVNSIDVLALSCYTWNRELNYRISKVVKEANPNCFVLAGGPEPDSDNPQRYFSKYPLIDIIVKREADHALPLIMDEIVNGTHQFDKITGLVINGVGDTGPVKYNRIYPDSVYMRYEDVYNKIASDLLKNNKRPVQLLEGDRGCPYQCAFCNKGGYEYKETTFTPLESVFQDIDWGGRNQVYYVDIVNSNFGRFKRDVDIARKLVESKCKHGYPELAFYSGAKTHSAEMAEILIELNKRDMLQHHLIALQSTNPDALDASNRVNMSKEDYLYLAKVSADHNIPACSQFILGLPGDTYEGTKNSYTSVMDMGLADNFMMFPYQVLPGSLAYTQKYRDEWEFETVVRHNQRQRRKIAFKTEHTSETEFLVGCSTFNKEDYIKMWRFSASILAYVGGNITRFLSTYLRLNHGISYLDFYSGLVEDFMMNPEYFFMYELNEKLYEHQRRFVYDKASDESFYEFPHHELEGFRSMFECDEYILISILLNFNLFKHELFRYIIQTYATHPNVERLKSILQFQTDIVITQNYNYLKDIVVYHDWINYFQKVKRNMWVGEFDEPKKEMVILTVNQTHSGPNKEWALDWNQYEGDERKFAYVEAVVGAMYKRSDRNTFDINRMVKL